VTVDVERLLVSAPAAGIEAAFPMDAFTQHRLLEGLDDVGLTLRYGADIDTYERTRPGWMPVARAGAR
jgi:3-isopropylmalate/(R)-2-methylmalate dehydratase small subunit